MRERERERKRDKIQRRVMGENKESSIIREREREKILRRGGEKSKKETALEIIYSMKRNVHFVVRF